MWVTNIEINSVENPLEKTLNDYLLVNFANFENKLDYVNLVANYKESVRNIINLDNSNMDILYSKVETAEWKDKLKFYDLFLHVKNNPINNNVENELNIA